MFAVGILAAELCVQGAGPRPDPVEVISLPPPAAMPTGFSTFDVRRTGVTFANRLTASLVVQNLNLMNGSGVAAGDYDGDGRCDLFFCAIAGTNALYRNLGDWRFEEVAVGAGVAGGHWASTGATFADLDGDGDLDLLVSTLGAGAQCFQNLGGGRFELATAEAGLTSTTGSTSFALGDIDGDGDLDLYVVNYGAHSVLRSGGRAEVRKANGKWEFTGPHAHRLRFVDGHVEEVGEAGTLYLNDGEGRFQAVPWNTATFTGTDGRPKPPPLDYGLGAQMRDVNGDGAPDLYICNDFQMPDRLWINDGQGRFREASFQALRKFSFSSMGVDFGDLDRDGNLDFMVVEMASREHARTMRQVTGLRPVPNLPGRFEARPQVVRNTLYRSNGDGTWSEIAEYAGLAATDWSWQPVFLDVDLDGFEDVLVVNGMLFDTQDRDTLARIQALGSQSPEAARTNLLLYPPFPSPNVAFRNLGKFTFRDVSADWHFNTMGVSQGVALADLDGDGDADLAINRLNDVALLCRNDCPAPRIKVCLRGRSRNTHGIGGRIRVEGGSVPQEQEILAGGRYLSGDEAFRTFACGSATQLAVRVSWRSGRTSIVSNAVPNTMLVIAEEGSQTNAPLATPSSMTGRAPWFTDESARLGHVHHEEVFDDFARQPLLPRQLSSLGPGVAWCDLDGDGRDELVIGAGRGGRLGAFRFSADGRATTMASDWIAPDDVVGLTGWVGRDRGPALLAAVAGYEVALTLGVRLFEITAVPGEARLKVVPVSGLPPMEGSVGPIAAADFDGDGDLDLFVGARVMPGAYPSAAASILLRREGKEFVPDPAASPILKGVGMVSGALWSDLENDGFPELILACEWGPVRILRNNQGRFVPWNPPVALSSPDNANRALSDFAGWWTSVTTADLNQDGRLDIVASNWGLNTGYRADFEHPLRLHYGKAPGSETMDLIEAYYAADSGKEVPRRSLNALARAFPFLAAQFPTHRAFGAAGIEDVLSGFPLRLETVQATTLASMVFLNLPDRWVASPLPAEAQYAPAFGMAAADADGDGKQDLFVSQNFFATRIEWPRTDAGRGLWLHGDGTGRFSSVSGLDSGVVILGEQRGAAIGDFDHDGRPDLAVGQNGAATPLWRNATGTQRLWVEVSGPPGNPSGYGTTLSAGGAGVREIRASTGYWSKDAAGISYGGPSRPSELLVRWPGGRERRVQIPSTGDRIRIGADGVELIQ